MLYRQLKKDNQKMKLTKLTPMLTTTDLKAKTKICYSIENFEYGMRKFAIYNNNDYVLQFGQEINETY
jgi:hypothetical protein